MEMHNTTWHSSRTINANMRGYRRELTVGEQNGLSRLCPGSPPVHLFCGGQIILEQNRAYEQTSCKGEKAVRLTCTASEKRHDCSMRSKHSRATKAELQAANVSKHGQAPAPPTFWQSCPESVRETVPGRELSQTCLAPCQRPSLRMQEGPHLLIHPHITNALLVSENRGYTCITMGICEGHRG
jgi:hypothetical protein